MAVCMIYNWLWVNQLSSTLETVFCWSTQRERKTTLLASSEFFSPHSGPLYNQLRVSLSAALYYYERITFVKAGSCLKVHSWRSPAAPRALSVHHSGGIEPLSNNVVQRFTFRKVSPLPTNLDLRVDKLQTACTLAVQERFHAPQSSFRCNNFSLLNCECTRSLEVVPNGTPESIRKLLWISWNLEYATCRTVVDKEITSLCCKDTVSPPGQKHYTIKIWWCTVYRMFISFFDKAY